MKSSLWFFGLVFLVKIIAYSSAVGVGFVTWPTLKTNSNLVKCLQSMLHSDNRTPRNYIRIRIVSDSQEDSWKFGEIVDELLGSINLDALFEIQNSLEKKCERCTIHRRIIFVSSIEAFKRQVRFQRFHTTDVSGCFQNFYVILSTRISNLHDALQRITQFCLENMIANLNILVESTDAIVTIYSYYPFTPTSCRNSKPHVHNYFTNGTFTWTRPVFPSKLENLWKCPLNVILWEEPPFVQNISHPGQMFGVDVSVLKYLASDMNFTWNIVHSPLGAGVVQSNGTFSNGLKMLNERLGDLMLSGSSFDSKRLSNFAATNIYFYSEIKLILKPPEKYSSLLILLSPFKKNTWLTILAALVGHWIIRGLSKMLATKFKISTCITTKLLAILWLLSILIFRSSYEGLIYRFIINNPYNKIPQNLDEARAAGYSFVMTRGMYNLYGHNFWEIENRTVVINVTANNILREFHKIDGKYGLLTSSSSMTVYRSEISPYKEDFQKWIVTKDAILHNYACIYLPKFSFLTPILNNRISQILSNGFRNKIFIDLIRNVLEHNEGREKKKNAKVQMSMEHFSGLFKVFAKCMGLGISLLLVEIISVRSRKIRKILNFFQRH